MTGQLPRIEVTLDDNLAAALEAVDPAGRTRAEVIRDLALRGAEAEQEDARRDATALLLSIADGDARYDMAAAGAMHATRKSGGEGYRMQVRPLGVRPGIDVDRTRDVLSALDDDRFRAQAGGL